MKLAGRVLSFAALVLVISAVVGRSEAAPACYNGASASVQFTQYWIPKEGSNDVDDNGNVISLSGPKTQNILQDDGECTTTLQVSISTEENTKRARTSCLVIRLKKKAMFNS